jgi:hypothetical protein
MKQLSRKEMRSLKGGFATGTANCGSSGTVGFNNCNGSVTCTDYVGCKCTPTSGGSATTKCCGGGSNCNIK